MKPKIIHLLSDRNVGGVTASVHSIIQSYLAEHFDFLLLTPAETFQNLSQTKPHLVIVHDALAWRLLPTLIRLRWHSKVLVHDHHYSSAFEALKVTNKWRFRLMLKLAYGLAHQVVAVSHGQGNWMLRRKLVNAKKLKVIQQCRVLKDFLALPVKPLGDRLVLGVYGRFSEQKGIDMLLQAMQRLPDLDIELLIGGYGEHEEKLHQLAKGDRRIRFVGKLANVPQFLETCDVVVIPSRWEPWGNVCLEAKAAGKPVIITNVDGLPEQVRDCGLIAEPKVEDLIAAITQIDHIYRNSPEILLEWGQQGRDNVQEAWTTYLANWKNLWEQLCRNSSL